MTHNKTKIKRRRILAVLTAAAVALSMSFCVLPQAGDVYASSSVSVTDAAGTTRESTGDMIVMFKKDVSSKSEAKKIVKSSSDTCRQVRKLGSDNYIAVVKPGSGRSFSEAKADYKSDSSVKAVYRNYKYKISSVTNDQAFTNSITNYTKYINATNTSSAWKLLKSKYSGKSKVKVAVVDTGANLSHEDLGSVDKDLSVDIDYYGNTSSLTADADTEVGHGTHVTGIIGATANNGVGLAGVGSGGDNSLLDLFVIGASDDGMYFYTNTLVYALDYAYENGAKVVNMSLGGEGEDEALDYAVDYLTEHGTLVVCAAGNSNTTATITLGDIDGALEVIALNDANKRAYFSNYGSKKDISAPGNSIYSCYFSNDANSNYTNYISYSGTSMATPIVTAIAAMVIYSHPDLTPADVIKDIEATATDLGSSGFDDSTAYGLINAYKAIRAITLTTPTITVKAGKKKETVKWSKIAYASGYLIYRATSKNGTYTFVKTRGSTKTSWTDTGLKANKRYYYKIRAYRTLPSTKVFSSYSAKKSAKTK